MTRDTTFSVECWYNHVSVPLFMIFPADIVYITQAAWCAETTICVEDTAGETFSLVLRDFPATAEADSFDTIFPVGSIVAIREPFLKVERDDPTCIVRVDSPSDVVFLHVTNPVLVGAVWSYPAPANTSLPQTVDGWKALGDSFYEGKEFFSSAVAYTKGLELDADAHPLRLNRAGAYLRLKYFTAALADAKSVQELGYISEVDRSEALYRVAQARYGLGQYEVAAGLFQDCLSIAPDLRDEVMAWAQRCHERIRETRGKYDWMEFLKHEWIPGKRFDVADFVGPIKLHPMPHRRGGRGTVTTRYVKAGELIVSS